MKVLHIIASVDPRTGGPIQGVKSIGEVAARLGHEVEVLTLDCPNEAFVQDFPGVLHAIGPSALGTYSLNFKLRRWLERHARKFDAVVINGLWQFHGFGAWRVLRQLGVPYFVFTHGMLDPWFKRTYPLKHLKKWLYWPWGQYPVLRDANGVLFTCEEERLLARESFWLYRCREIVVSYGAPDVPVDREIGVRAFLTKFPHLRDKRCLLFLGRIEKKKGCDLLINAFAKVAQSDKSLHLVMAGPDQIGWQSDLSEIARSAGIEERVTWTGMLTGELKWGALQTAEVFCLPSHTENFGIAVAEALACATPVVISNRVNIWREIASDNAGVIHSDTLDGTVAGLSKWVSLGAEDRETLSRNARQCFEGRFHIDKVVADLHKVLGKATQVSTSEGVTLREAS